MFKPTKDVLFFPRSRKGPFMPKFKIAGSATVATLKRRFREEIGVVVRVYAANGRMAGDSDTLSAIRAHKPQASEIDISGRAKLRRVHQQFEDQFGVAIMILGPDGAPADDDITLAAARRAFSTAAPPTLPEDQGVTAANEHPEYPRRDETLIEAVTCLYLHLACQSGNPNEKISDILATIMMWYRGTGEPDWDEYARVDFNGGAISFNDFMARDDYSFVNTSLDAIRDRCDPAQRAEVMRNTNDLVHFDDMIPQGAMTLLCQMADAWGLPLRSGLHRPNTSMDGKVNRRLADLVNAGVMFNLYNNVAIWGMDESDFAKWDAQDTEGTYRHHLYGFVFSNNPADPLMKYLRKRLSKKALERVFPGFGHAPTIGVYNALDESLIGIGLGRKDQIFVVTSDDAIDEDKLAETFCRRDCGEIVQKLIAQIEAAGDINGHAMQAEDPDERDSICEEADEELEVVRRLIPTIPGTVCEISPCDY